jgi:hypothetical protein
MLVALGVLFGALLLLLAIGVGVAAIFSSARKSGQPAGLAAQADPVRHEPASQEPLARNDPAGQPPRQEPYRPAPFDRPGDFGGQPPVRSLTSLPPEEQQKVNEAIDKGVRYLKSTQQGGGGWGGGNKVGYAALPGLTLLECGVPATDPAVQKAAEVVRAGAPAMVGGHETYELSLAILFLDRLGDARDRPAIQTMAMRLIVGQNPDGGWGYNCPLLQRADEQTLLTLLQQSRPTSALELFQQDDGPSNPFLPTQRVPGSSTPAPNPAPRPFAKPPPGKPPRPGNSWLPPGLAGLPGVEGRLTALAGRRSRSDNSNTQFAALALWAARRHDVPMERTLAALDGRFRGSQGDDGSWGYMSGTGARVRDRGTPAMSCSGLLGLALGAGVIHELEQARQTGRAPSKAVEDQQIKQGLDYLSLHVGQPGEGMAARLRLENLYYLWSLERVAVLYNLKTVGGKDWYRWGAQMLVANQDGNGGWRGGRYHGSTVTLDTCFALLFLKRANLAKDLTDKLEFLVEVKP